MIGSFVRRHGLYLLLFASAIVLQSVIDALGPAGPAVVGPTEGPKEVLDMFDPRRAGGLPTGMLAMFVGVIVVFGMGLIADAVLAMKWFVARSRGKPFLVTRETWTSPWHVEDIAKIFVIFLFAASLVDGLAKIAISQRWVGSAEIGGIYLFLQSVGLYALVLFILHRWRRQRGAQKQPWEDFSGAGWGSGLRTGVVSYFAFIPPLAFLLLVSIVGLQIFGVEARPHDLVEVLAKEPNMGRFIYLGALTVMIGPIVEEILFRGVAYGALRKRLGVAGAALLSAGLFALAHTNAAQTLPIFGMGVLLALLYEHTGSLLASMTFHVINNAMAFALTVSMLRAGA